MRAQTAESPPHRRPATRRAHTRQARQCPRKNLFRREHPSKLSWSETAEPSRKFWRPMPTSGFPACRRGFSAPKVKLKARSSGMLCNVMDKTCIIIRLRRSSGFFSDKQVAFEEIENRFGSSNSQVLMMNQQLKNLKSMDISETASALNTQAAQLMAL